MKNKSLSLTAANGLYLAAMVLVVSLDERSRCFLVKQGHASAVCQLNLRGLDDHLAVISASTDNIEIMHRVLDSCAEAEGCALEDLAPEQWLTAFYENRKGSGEGKNSPGAGHPLSKAMTG